MCGIVMSKDPNPLRGTGLLMVLKTNLFLVMGWFLPVDDPAEMMGAAHY